MSGLHISYRQASLGDPLKMASYHLWMGYMERSPLSVRIKRKKKPGKIILIFDLTALTSIAFFLP